MSNGLQGDFEKLVFDGYSMMMSTQIDLSVIARLTEPPLSDYAIDVVVDGVGSSCSEELYYANEVVNAKNR